MFEPSLNVTLSNISNKKFNINLWEFSLDTTRHNKLGRAVQINLEHLSYFADFGEVFLDVSQTRQIII